MFCPRGAGASRDGLGFIYMGSLEGGLPHTYGEIHFENGDSLHCNRNANAYTDVDAQDMMRELEQSARDRATGGSSSDVTDALVR
jgi:hypothetical protein